MIRNPLIREAFELWEVVRVILCSPEAVRDAAMEIGDLISVKMMRFQNEGTALGVKLICEKHRRHNCYSRHQRVFL